MPEEINTSIFEYTQASKDESEAIFSARALEITTNKKLIEALQKEFKNTKDKVQDLEKEILFVEKEGGKFFNNLFRRQKTKEKMEALKKELTKVNEALNAVEITLNRYKSLENHYDTYEYDPFKPDKDYIMIKKLNKESLKQLEGAISSSPKLSENFKSALILQLKPIHALLESKKNEVNFNISNKLFKALITNLPNTTFKKLNNKTPKKKTVKMENKTPAPIVDDINISQLLETNIDYEKSLTDNNNPIPDKIKPFESNSTPLEKTQNKTRNELIITEKARKILILNKLKKLHRIEQAKLRLEHPDNIRILDIVNIIKKIEQSPDATKAGAVLSEGIFNLKIIQNELMKNKQPSQLELDSLISKLDTIAENNLKTEAEELNTDNIGYHLPNYSYGLNDEDDDLENNKDITLVSSNTVEATNKAVNEDDRIIPTIESKSFNAISNIEPLFKNASISTKGLDDTEFNSDNSTLQKAMEDLQNRWGNPEKSPILGSNKKKWERDSLMNYDTIRKKGGLKLPTDKPTSVDKEKTHPNKPKTS